MFQTIPDGGSVGIDCNDWFPSVGNGSSGSRILYIES